MRPANLIPVEERRERGIGLRSASLAYILVGALILALGAVTLTVTTGNEISSRKAEVAEGRQQTATAEARATELASYTQFHATATARTETISNLAKSRFDWERVMRELALVLPDDVWLNNLTGSVRPDVSVGGGESVALRSAVAGPALSMAGCATGQEAVAGFVTALKDIGGVTRVGVQTSAVGGEAGGAESVSASGGCSGKGDASFQIVVAFDAAPIPTPVAGGELVVEEPAPEAAPEEGSTETSSETSEAPAEGE